MVRRFFIQVLVSAIALWVADYFLAGFVVLDGIRSYFIAGFVLGSVNIFIRPFLKLIAFPLIMASLGLFTLIINAGILWFVSEALDRVAISDIWSLVWATLIISIVNIVFEPVTKQ